MKSPIVKRSIVIGGHKTSVSLEEAFWSSMKEISAQRATSVSELVSEIDGVRQQGLYVLDRNRSQVAPLATDPKPRRTVSIPS